MIFQRFLFLFIITISVSGYSQQPLQGRIYFIKGKVLEIGIPYEAIVEISPSEALDSIEVKDFHKEDISPHFYFSKIHKIEKKKDDLDALIIKCTIVITSPFKDVALQQLKIKDRYIPTTIEDVELDFRKIDLPKEFIIANQEGEIKSKFNKKLLGILAIGFVILSIWLGNKYHKNSIHKKNQKKKQEFKKEHWISYLRKANNRIEFEKLSANKNEWLEYVDIEKKALNNFLKKVEMYQYHPSWDEKIENEVKSAYKKIKV